MKETLSAVAIATLVAVSGPVSAELRIGLAGPMTGQYAAVGGQMKAGAERAVEDINGAGGVDGSMLELVVGDPACDPERAVAVADRLASEGVVFVVGHFCSGSSIPASAVYARRGVVMISPASTAPAFTDERPADGVFRMSGRDDREGDVAGAFLAEQFAGERVAFLHDRTAYGKGLADAAVAAFEAAGGEPLMYEDYAVGETDHAALVARLGDEGADVVYVGGHHAEAGLIKRRMSERGLDTVLVSGDALATDEYWAITGDAGEGTLMTLGPDPRRHESAADLVAAFRERGIEPEGHALRTYAAVQVWADAAATAGDAGDYDAVVGALHEGEFATVLGALSFDGAGDVSLPSHVLYEWKDGRYDYHEPSREPPR